MPSDAGPELAEPIDAEGYGPAEQSGGIDGGNPGSESGSEESPAVGSESPTNAAEREGGDTLERTENENTELVREDRNADRRAELEAQIAALDAQIAEKQQRSADLNSRIEERLNSKAASEGQLANAKETLKGWEQESNAAFLAFGMVQNADPNSDEYKKAVGRLVLAEREVARAQGQIEAIKEAISRDDAALEPLQSDYNILQYEIDGLIVQRSLLVQQLEALD